jgi:Ca2+-binding EF-hand superfamily protein
MEQSNTNKNKEEKMSISDLRKKLRNYETKRWQESRGKFVEFDIKTMNKYKKYYVDIASINPDGEDGMGIDQLEEPFISLGLAYSREEVGNLIRSVDDDGSGRIEFDEFLRIIHNKSKKKSKIKSIYFWIKKFNAFP